VRCGSKHDLRLLPPLTPALSPFVKYDGEREVISLSPSFTGKGLG